MDLCLFLHPAGIIMFIVENVPNHPHNMINEGNPLLGFLGAAARQQRRRRMNVFHLNKYQRTCMFILFGDVVIICTGWMVRWMDEWSDK